MDGGSWWAAVHGVAKSGTGLSDLISFIPADILHFGKFLGSLYHKVNEVPTSTQAANDEEVGQDAEKSCQMDIFFFATLLFIHY